MVMFFDTEPIAYGQRLDTRKNSRARITLLLSAVPILLIAWQIENRLIRLHLGFLQAEYIGIKLAK